MTSVIDEHYQFVYRYAYRLSGQQADAEDLTQQTFLAAQRHWDQLRHVGAIRGWLCTIVRNTFLQGLRRNLDPLPIPELVVSVTETSPPGEIDQEELQLALQSISEEFRAPLVLFYFGEFSYKQIAEMLGIPLGTVMSRISRAKGLLRQKLAPELSGEQMTHSPTIERASGTELPTSLIEK